MSVHKKTLTYRPAVETQELLRFAAKSGGVFMGLIVSSASVSNIFSLQDDSGLIIIASAEYGGGVTVLADGAVPLPLCGVISIVTTVIGTAATETYTIYWEE